MTQEFVPYEQALALEELGFNEPCFGGYDMETLKLWIGYLNDGEQFNREYYYPAPTFSQAFRFFREKYYIFSCIMTEYSYGGHISAYHINGERQSNISKGDFATYEEAELACLIKLIEIVK